MFLTKDRFQDSIRILTAIDDFDNEDDLKISLAEEYAIEMFEDYEDMDDISKESLITMIIEDMSHNFYSLN